MCVNIVPVNFRMCEYSMPGYFLSLDIFRAHNFSVLFYLLSCFLCVNLLSADIDERLHFARRHVFSFLLNFRYVLVFCVLIFTSVDIFVRMFFWSISNVSLCVNILHAGICQWLPFARIWFLIYFKIVPISSHGPGGLTTGAATQRPGHERPHRTGPDPSHPPARSTASSLYCGLLLIFRPSISFARTCEPPTPEFEDLTKRKLSASNRDRNLLRYKFEQKTSWWEIWNFLAFLEPFFAPLRVNTSKIQTYAKWFRKFKDKISFE